MALFVRNRSGRLVRVGRVPSEGGGFRSGTGETVITNRRGAFTQEIVARRNLARRQEAERAAQAEQSPAEAPAETTETRPGGSALVLELSTPSTPIPRTVAGGVPLDANRLRRLESGTTRALALSTAPGAPVPRGVPDVAETPAGRTRAAERAAREGTPRQAAERQFRELQAQRRTSTVFGIVPNPVDRLSASVAEINPLNPLAPRGPSPVGEAQILALTVIERRRRELAGRGETPGLAFGTARSALLLATNPVEPTALAAGGRAAGFAVARGTQIAGRAGFAAGGIAGAQTAQTAATATAAVGGSALLVGGLARTPREERGAFLLRAAVAASAAPAGARDAGPTGIEVVRITPGRTASDVRTVRTGAGPRQTVLTGRFETPLTARVRLFGEAPITVRGAQSVNIRGTAEPGSAVFQVAGREVSALPLPARPSPFGARFTRPVSQTARTLTSSQQLGGAIDTARQVGGVVVTEGSRPLAGRETGVFFRLNQAEPLSVRTQRFASDTRQSGTILSRRGVQGSRSELRVFDLVRVEDGRAFPDTSRALTGQRFVRTRDVRIIETRGGEASVRQNLGVTVSRREVVLSQTRGFANRADATRTLQAGRALLTERGAIANAQTRPQLNRIASLTQPERTPQRAPSVVTVREPRVPAFFIPPRFASARPPFGFFFAQTSGAAGAASIPNIFATRTQAPRQFFVPVPSVAINSVRAEPTPASFDKIPQITRPFQTPFTDFGGGFNPPTISVPSPPSPSLPPGAFFGFGGGFLPAGFGGRASRGGGNRERGIFARSLTGVFFNFDEDAGVRRRATRRNFSALTGFEVR